MGSRDTKSLQPLPGGAEDGAPRARGHGVQQDGLGVAARHGRHEASQQRKGVEEPGSAPSAGGGEEDEEWDHASFMPHF